MLGLNCRLQVLGSSITVSRGLIAWFIVLRCGIGTLPEIRRPTLLIEDTLGMDTSRYQSLHMLTQACLNDGQNAAQNSIRSVVQDDHLFLQVCELGAWYTLLANQ